MSLPVNATLQKLVASLLGNAAGRGKSFALQQGIVPVVDVGMLLEDEQRQWGQLRQSQRDNETRATKAFICTLTQAGVAAEVPSVGVLLKDAANADDWVAYVDGFSLWTSVASEVRYGTGIELNWGAWTGAISQLVSTNRGQPGVTEVPTNAVVMQRHSGVTGKTDSVMGSLQVPGFAYSPPILFPNPIRLRRRLDASTLANANAGFAVFATTVNCSLQVTFFVRAFRLADSPQI